MMHQKSRKSSDCGVHFVYLFIEFTAYCRRTFIDYMIVKNEFMLLSLKENGNENVLKNKKQKYLVVDDIL